MLKTHIFFSKRYGTRNINLHNDVTFTHAASGVISSSLSSSLPNVVVMASSLDLLTDFIGSGVIKILNMIEVTITDDMEKASAFCKYFSSVFTKVDASHEQG